MPSRSKTLNLLRTIFAILALAASTANALSELALPIKKPIALRDLCGPDNSQEVEQYDGKLGIAIKSVAAMSGSTVLLEWPGLLEFRERLPGYRLGNLYGRKWCTGTLFGGRYILTAGHCIEHSNGKFEYGVHVPMKRTDDFSYIEPKELAKFLYIRTNYQVDSRGINRKDQHTIRIGRLLESSFRSASGLDYAILSVHDDDLGKINVGSASISTSNVSKGDIIAVIQHPLGGKKKINANSVTRTDGKTIWYDNIDTQLGSSGAAIRNEKGDIVGVHTDAGCEIDEDGNFGNSISAIVKESKFLSNFVAGDDEL